MNLIMSASILEISSYVAYVFNWYFSTTQNVAIVSSWRLCDYLVSSIILEFSKAAPGVFMKK